MKHRVALAVAVCALLAPGAATPSRAQTEAAQPAAPPAAKPAASPEAAAMEAWVKANLPGEPHKLLAEMAGKWDLEVKTWPAPGAPPTVTRGSCTSRVIMGGRVLLDEFTGEMMGQPFTGLGLTGYDNAKRKYWSTWNDSMSTGIFLSQGTYDAAARTLTTTGTTYDPTAGKEVPVRTLTRFLDDNQHVFEWYAPGPDGKEMLSMEITYTRGK